MSITTESSADDILAIARKGKPNVRYAKGKAPDSAEYDVIGAWDEKQDRFVPVAAKLINGRGWVSMPWELLVNGSPMKIEWAE